MSYFYIQKQISNKVNKSKKKKKYNISSIALKAQRCIDWLIYDSITIVKSEIEEKFTVNKWHFGKIKFIDLNISGSAWDGDSILLRLTIFDIFLILPIFMSVRVSPYFNENRMKLYI